ncbi:MAG TPA: triose-phosphate isomerase [Oligoflexia bacterium]|nr:triose-phosphate isomerase [Oligoflexia bacterium]HMP27021.1 triose-phosphate isomerase [Oligoflexia bacterium]
MKKIIVANWKMNLEAETEIGLFQNYLTLLPATSQEIEVWIAPSYLSLIKIIELRDYASRKQLRLGAQDASEAEPGAKTGEISAMSLKKIGADFVIIGHSERRSHLSENSKLCAQKAIRALSSDLKVIFCVGENLSQREKGELAKILSEQIAPLFEIDRKLMNQKIKSRDLIFAYEPVWAIGTGKAATPQIAVAAHEQIVAICQEFADLPTTALPVILYGGSVNPQNIADFTTEPLIGGVLVGGASLQAETFAEIIEKTTVC